MHRNNPKAQHTNQESRKDVSSAIGPDVRGGSLDLIKVRATTVSNKKMKSIHYLDCLPKADFVEDSAYNNRKHSPASGRAVVHANGSDGVLLRQVRRHHCHRRRKYQPAAEALAEAQR